MFIMVGWTGVFSGMFLIAIAEGLQGLEIICDNIAQLQQKGVNTTAGKSEMGVPTSSFSDHSYNLGSNARSKTINTPKSDVPVFDMSKATSKQILRNKAYDDGPIFIRNARLYISDSGAAVKISMKNISEKTIIAVKILVTTKDVMGSVIDNDFSHIIMDISIAPGQLLGDKEVIILPSKALVRDANIHVEMVKFSDGTVWNRNGKDLSDIEIKNEFVFADHEQTLLAFPDARAIYDYLNELDITDDPQFTDELMPQIEQMLDIERMYGNAKESTIKKIRAIYPD